MAATVYHHLGIDARSIYFRDLLDPMPLLDKGEAIRELGVKIATKPSEWPRQN